MGKGKQKKRRQVNAELKLILVLLGVFILALLVLLSIDFGGTIIHKVFGKPELITIQGECYAAFNSVIYQITSEDDCMKQCSDECWVRKMDYKGSQFVPTSTCNLCDCYCK